MPWKYLPSLIMRRNKIFHDLNEIMKKLLSLIKEMSEINMQNCLNTLWEFTRGEEDKQLHSKGA